MKTRELTEEERLKLDAAWEIYLNKGCDILFDNTKDVDAIDSIFNDYNKVLESLNIIPTPAGYRVKIDEN